MFRKFVENRVRKHENGYYCSLCENFLLTKDAVLSHCDPKNVFHNRLKQAQFNEPEPEFKILSETKFRQLVENHILQIRPSVYRCDICDCVMQSLISVFTHIKGTRHIKNKKSSNKNICGTKHILNVEVAQRVWKKTELSEQKQNNYVIKGTCLQKLEQVSSKKQCTSKQQDLSKNPSDPRFCKLCNINLCTEENFKEHVLGRKHRKKQSEKVFNANLPLQHLSKQQKHVTQSLDCKLCNVKVDCEKTLFDHLQGKRHLKNLLNSSKTIVANQNRESNTPFSSISVGNQLNSTSSSPVLICFMCNTTFSREETMVQHLAKPTNGCKVSSFLELNKWDNGLLFYKCVLCDVDIPNTPCNLIQHTQGRKHKKSVEILREKSNPNVIDWNPKTKKPTQGVSKQLENSNTYVFGLNIVSKKTEQQKNQSVKKKSKKKNLHQSLKILNILKDEPSKHKCLNDEHLKDELLALSINIANTNFFYKCYVCNVTACSDLELFEHLKDSKHKSILTTFPRDYIPFIYCPACESDIFEDEKMISHLNSDEHKNRSFHNPAKLDNIRDQKNLLDYDPESKTIIDELCSEMIRKPRRPNTDLKKKNKTTLHFGNEYSRIFLEVGPFNIFNIAQEKIQNLKSGTELLFLLLNERLCLVCYQRIPNNLQLLYEHLFHKDHIRKLNQMINNDLQFENFRDQFSDLALAKEFLKEVDDKIVFCFACKEEISNDDNVIKKHVETYGNHIIKSHDQKQLTQKIFKTFNEQLNNAWYIVQRFWCQLCNAKFEHDIDFADHLEEKKHLSQVEKSLSQGMDICLDVCIPCASMSLGHLDTYTKHCEDKMHKYLVKSKDYAVPEMIKPAKNLLTNVEEITENLVRQSNAATLLEKNIDLVLKFMEQAVKSHYPEAKAYVFGSRASYLAFNSSDVDIFLDCGSAYNGMQLLSKSREYLLNSQKCFESQPDVWDLKEVLLKVRAPIIKVRHRELGLNCDVSFTNGLTVEKTKIVKLFMTSFPPCRKMVLYLKKWLNTCLLTDSQGLTTFGITWLVIFYLQRIKILPSIGKLIKNKSQSKIVGGWETGIAQNISIKHSSLTFKALLTGFFEFYANYDYRTCVISPLMGNSLRKQDFTDNRNAYLPVEMESYSRYIKSTHNPEIFRIDSPLCLQDPIDLAQNITRSVSKLILRCFKQYCLSSAEILRDSR